MLDPQEFLSDYGIRSISKYHAAHSYELNTRYGNFSVNYEPGESTTGAFGGNSNWRGPIWFPINFLLVEALQKYQQFYGDDFLVECPTGSGTKLTLVQVAEELSRRLTNIFLREEKVRRAVFVTCTGSISCRCIASIIILTLTSTITDINQGAITSVRYSRE